MSAIVFCILLAAFQGLTAEAPLTDTSASPHAAVQAVGLTEVHWTGGFWPQRWDTLQNRSISAMWEIMKG
jgi:hypothetical protein